MASAAEQLAANFSFRNLGKATELRQRIFFTLGALIVARLGTYIPMPGIDPASLAQQLQQQQGGILDVFNVLAGGAIGRMAIFALGIMPYISASIIIQLMTTVFPELEALKKEGAAGQKTINQYTRYGTVGLAALQAYGIAIGLEHWGNVVIDPGWFFRISAVITLTGGTILLMWIGEQIDEYGIGNGISFIIFAGIVSRAPTAIGAFMANPDLASGTAFAIVAVAAVAVIIYIQEGQRRIPIQYASRVRGRRLYQGGQTFLPLRVNQAGVIPIIFAVSILLFPVQIAQYFTTSQVAPVKDVAQGIVTFFGNTFIYGLLYFLLTVGFTYFYTAFTFKPDETAEQLRKNGGFIPGIRPGRPTQDYLAKIVTRITLAGALFLGAVAVAPYVISAIFQNLSGLTLGGTGLLIVVSVVVETMKQIEAQLLMRNYEGFIR